MNFCIFWIRPTYILITIFSDDILNTAKAQANVVQRHIGSEILKVWQNVWKQICLIFSSSQLLFILSCSQTFRWNNSRFSEIKSILRYIFLKKVSTQQLDFAEFWVKFQTENGVVAFRAEFLRGKVICKHSLSYDKFNSQCKELVQSENYWAGRAETERRKIKQNASKMSDKSEIVEIRVI